MTAVPSNAVFISYRRDVGGMLAMALYQQLTEHGFDAFYDIESLRAGQFDTIITNQITARPYFVLVLTPGTLERCADANDYLRREIEQAVATRRVIVPAYTPNFEFADLQRFLPGELGQQVARFNAQELPQRWFKSAVQQLVEEFLLPIQLEGVEPPLADEAVVAAIREQAQAAPIVTSTQLSAQEYAERAFDRADDDLDGQIADYSEAIRLDPDDGDLFHLRGIARAEKGDLDGAIADYDEAIRLTPYDDIQFQNRGHARSEKGDRYGAIADYNEAILLNPDDADYFHSRGNARSVNGDVRGAIADYDEAIRLNPDDDSYFNSRGLARTKRSKWGDLDGAIADYDEAIRLNPENGGWFNNRGNARRWKGDPDGAIADYDEAIRLNPEYSGAFYNRGLARADKGDLDGAIADVVRGAGIAPDDEQFPKLLRQLTKRREKTKRRENT